MALRADGSGDYAIRTAGGFPALNSFTVCFWFLLESDRNAISTLFGLRNTGPPDYLFYYNLNGDGTTFGWEYGNGSTFPSFDSTAISLNTWTFVAFAASGTGSNQATAYRRGVSDAALNAASGTLNNLVTVDEETVLSSGFSLAAEWFPGRIAGLKQWSAALTAAELLAESHQILPVRFANLHSFRPFVDNTVAGNMVDYSGNGRSLTANGSLLVADGPPIAWKQGQSKIFIPVAAGGGPVELNLSGSITPAGALIKSISKPLSGSITPSGAFQKTLSRLLSGQVAPSGALLRQAQKTLAGSAAPTGAIAKFTSKPLTGSVTPTGALSTIKAILLGFSGSITPAGALAKQAGKALAGAITPAGSALKAVAKSFTGSITPSGALATLKAVLLSFGGSIAPTGAIRRAVGKALTGSITPSGAAAKRVSKLFSGILTLAGNLINFIEGAPAPKTIIATSDELVTRTATSDELVTICTASDEIGGQL